MEEQKHDAATFESSEDLFEPAAGYVPDEILEERTPLSATKQRLVEKRRLAEQRLEEHRLRDELGDYSLELND